MRMWLRIISLAGLLAFPFQAGAADYGSLAQGTDGAPPVAQTLVREGDFAVNLSAAILGITTTETEAEELLVKADIAPVNGWLSDYPMTPQIIGQLEEAIIRSASQGKLSMSSDQAVQGLYGVAERLNLPTPAEQGPKGSPPPVPEGRLSQQVVDDYYYDTGPPVVTYYPPPYGYVYLYDWVPYPVWWYGFWFPGFYICHDFTTVIVSHSHPAVVTNHFRDIHTGTVGRVDPRGHWGEHDRRPQSELRTARGERFMTLADIRSGVSVAGPSGEAKRPGERTSSGTERRLGPEVRRGARTAYAGNMRVPLPERGMVRGERGGREEGLRRSSGRTVVGPSARQYVAGERSHYVPSQRYTATPSIRESQGAWGGHVARSSRSFSNGSLSSVNGLRSPGRSFSGTGGRGVYRGR